MAVYKVKTTDTHVYFLTGPFSQWHPSKFITPVGGTDVMLEFNCGEQYMMAEKALFFGDTETFKKIMAVQPVAGRPFIEVPKKQKALGRTVKPFVEEKWTKEVATGIVFAGNLPKFSQNPGMMQELLDTGDRHLVEGASYDRIWGVGLAWDDPAILDEANWLGTNWLGEVLMDVRTVLQVHDE
jgi:ribA/ribD-fused uncharacterized protein